LSQKNNSLNIFFLQVQDLFFIITVFGVLNKPNSLELLPGC